MLFAGVFALLFSAGAPDVIPEGTILPVVLNETLNTAKVQDNDPVLFTLVDDVRAAGHRGPVLIPRGSDIVGRIVKAQRAGHFVGRSEMNIVLQEIITPTGEVYDGVSTKIIDFDKKKGKKVKSKPMEEYKAPFIGSVMRSCFCFHRRHSSNSWRRRSAARMSCCQSRPVFM